jgi:dolichol-phosphate mannosyltransferase
MDIRVVIPTYNERESLAAIVEATLQHHGYKVLVVDDASPDGTGALADALAQRFAGRVDVLHRSGPRGFGRSYLDGMAWSLAHGADLICQMDADFSHDPQYLPTLVGAAADADVVVGSRYLHGVSVVNWPLRRLFLSTMANQYIRRVTGLPVHDCTSGFKCWRRAALEAVTRQKIASDGYAFQFEMLYNALKLGFRLTEVPIIFVERRQGKSKLSGRMIAESVLAPWRLLLRSTSHRQ